jgi:aldehyde:ferredoxin oxidoreductase
MAQLLRLDMSRRTATLQELPEAYRLLGGRGMTSRIVHDEVDPQGHALGPSNKLVIAPGIVTGTSAPTSSRLSVGGKSPLTGGIKEANAGTGFAPALASLGIRALVVEGYPQEKGWWMVRIGWDEAGLQPKIE